VPIVTFSVDWWNSLHQPASVFRRGGPTIDPSLLSPLIVMALAYLALFVALWLTAMKTEILKRRIHQMQIAAAEA
jgi:heme exporter protein C